MPAAKAAALMFVVGAVALSGCSILSGSDDHASQPKAGRTQSNTAWTSAPRRAVAPGGTLRLAVGAIPTTFNPQQADATSEASTILAPTTGGAIRITRDGGWDVDRNYAASVKVASSDPLTIEVLLNPKAVWQGGTAITAKDMVAFWKAQNGSDSDFKVSSTIGYEDIAKVKVSNPNSYKVVFDKRTADWPLYIYPRLPANVSSDAKLFNTAFRSAAPSSNGPFVVGSIDAKTGTVTETPNPRWWGDKPALKKIVWRAASPVVQARAYEAGELDAIKVGVENFPTVKRGALQRAPGLEWTQVTLNGARGPLKDVNVRRAVAHAIDRKQIADRSAAELGAKGRVLGSLIFVPGQRGYHDSSASIAYDPKESARLLAKAGYTKNATGVLERKGKPLVLTMPVPDKTVTNSERAESVKQDLKAVGIQVKLRPVPADAFFDKYVIALDFDLVTFAWRGSAFPVSAAEPLFFPVDSGQNFTGRDDPAVGEQWQKVKSTLDDVKRAEGVRSLDVRLFKDVSIVPFAATPIVVAVGKGVVNFGAAQFEKPDWTLVGFAKKKG